MKKILLAICALVALCSCNDDDPIPISQAVLNSFIARFPEARNVTWQSSDGYLVADFYLNENGVPEECLAWFTPVGEWQMTQREMMYANLPVAVRAAFESSDYATWVIDDVVQVERISSVEYVISAEGFYLGVESDAYLYYDEAGVLVRSVIDPDYEYWGYMLQPICINQ